jgi:hypothetical protein
MPLREMTASGYDYGDPQGEVKSLVPLKEMTASGCRLWRPSSYVQAKSFNAFERDDGKWM